MLSHRIAVAGLSLARGAPPWATKMALLRWLAAGCSRHGLTPRRALCSGSARSFAELGLRAELIDAAHTLGYTSPSAVQEAAIPRLSAGASLAVASSTGSGKTLAYLLPVFEQLKAQEDRRPDMRSETRPRVIILAPTRDLVEQIAGEAKRLSHHCRVRVRALAAGTKIGDQKRSLASGSDLIIATPGRLMTLFKMGALSLREVRTVVVDEADDILLRGFADDLDEILRFCGAKRLKDQLAGAKTLAPERGTGHLRDQTPEGHAQPAALPGAGGRGGYLQLALFSATLSAETRHVISKGFPRMEFCFTACAHKTPPTLKHRLLYVEGDKMTLLIEQARRLASQTQTLIFCRGVDSARAVQNSLAEAGLPVGGCHGGMPDEARAEALATFSAQTHSLLVATDLAARGLHLPHVSTVVNFDFPASSALYLHRAGRTARYGAKGEVISLVTKRQAKAAQTLQDALTSRRQIHALDYGGKLSGSDVVAADRIQPSSRRPSIFDDAVDRAQVKQGEHWSSHGDHDEMMGHESNLDFQRRPQRGQRDAYAKPRQPLSSEALPPLPGLKRNAPSGLRRRVAPTQRRRVATSM